MNEHSPNKSRIDILENRLDERFDHRKMEDWTLERVNEERWLLEDEFLRFKEIFPPKGGLEGTDRAWTHDNQHEELYSLSADERMRLRHMKRSALGEIYRAEGKRRDKDRDHRLKIYNTFVDFTKAIGNSIRSIFPS
ncbi:hypothetical protein [Haladaptatus sp. DJG-WS-42]|uniref:hypothetical protein n=1 Tax=Haladaptatus sp. DJG-WS-42 TaxID=3120516 RepID=UPI0030D59ED8